MSWSTTALLIYVSWNCALLILPLQQRRGPCYQKIHQKNSSFFPLFPNDAKSVAMITHAMIKDGIRYVNPNKTPVIAIDQPLFALSKQIQWTWKSVYGESKFVIMFGGLHLEMGFMKAIGDWLEYNGWTSALVNANIESCGTAASFLKASNVKRTRKDHQITACSLYTLLVRAYKMYKEGLPADDSLLQFDGWCNQRKSDFPQFYFWYIAMQLELLLLAFIRSLRQANFSKILCERQGSWCVYIPVRLSWWIGRFLECRLYGLLGRRCSLFWRF